MVEMRKRGLTTPDELVSEAYGQLHGIAQALLRHERSDHTLQPAGLVNEAWIRSLRKMEAAFPDRETFLRIASRVMRRVLKDHARRSKALKRRPTMMESGPSIGASREDIMTLEESMRELERNDPIAAEIVRLRLAENLSVEEVAGRLSVSRWRVKEDYAFAIGWLRRRNGAETFEADDSAGMYLTEGKEKQYS